MSTTSVLLRSIIAFVIIVVGIPQEAYGQVPSPSPPSYAQPSTEQMLRGRISAVNGAFNISVRDKDGNINSVGLHRGTIINPTGLTLAVGMRVNILGYNAGAVFEANEIDTPYTYAGPPPPPMYYGPGWWYPRYMYGYGPAFGLIVHGNEGRPNIEHGAFPHHRGITQPLLPRPYVGRPYGKGAEPAPGRPR
jgi:hypothetical protein